MALTCAMPNLLYFFIIWFIIINLCIKSVKCSEKIEGVCDWRMYSYGFNMLNRDRVLRRERKGSDGTFVRAFEEYLEEEDGAIIV